MRVLKWTGALVALAVAGPVSAQQPAAPAAVAAPDEAELTVYAEAMLDIEAIQAEFTPQIEAAETEEAKAALKQQQDERVAQVLATREIEKERYDAIGTLVQQDPELKARFDELKTKIAEERKKAGG